MTVLVDIGSTIVKIAQLGAEDNIEAYEFHDRDYDPCQLGNGMRAP